MSSFSSDGIHKYQFYSQNPQLKMMIEWLKRRIILFSFIFALNTEECYINEAEVFSLPIKNPNRRPMLPFDWLIHSGLNLACCLQILENYQCNFLFYFLSKQCLLNSLERKLAFLSLLFCSSTRESPLCEFELFLSMNSCLVLLIPECLCCFEDYRGWEISLETKTR